MTAAQRTKIRRRQSASPRARRPDSCRTTKIVADRMTSVDHPALPPCSTDARFEIMTRQGSVMTIDDIKIKEVTALVSIIDVIDHRSSDDDDESDDRAREQNGAISENKDPGVSTYTSESSMFGVMPGDSDHHGQNDDDKFSSISSSDDITSPNVGF